MLCCFAFLGESKSGWTGFREIFCGGGTLEKKFHLVNWSIVCRSKEKGGLGICSLSSLNRALLGKWHWHFVLEANSAWRRFIKLKYETESGG